MATLECHVWGRGGVGSCLKSKTNQVQVKRKHGRVSFGCFSLLTLSSSHDAVDAPAVRQEYVHHSTELAHTVTANSYRLPAWLGCLFRKAGDAPQPLPSGH